MNHHVSSTRCIDQREELTKEKIQLLGSAIDESTVKAVESMEDAYSGPTKETSTKKMKLYLDFMRHKVVFANMSFYVLM